MARYRPKSGNKRCLQDLSDLIGGRKKDKLGGRRSRLSRGTTPVQDVAKDAMSHSMVHVLGGHGDGRLEMVNLAPGDMNGGAFVMNRV